MVVDVTKDLTPEQQAQYEKYSGMPVVGDMLGKQFARLASQHNINERTASQAEIDAENRKARKQEAIEAAEGIAEGARANVRALEAAQRRGNLAIQAALANTLAQTQGAAGMVSGAGTAGLRQAAATAGQQQAQFGLAAEQRLGRARTAADQAQLGALRFAAETGDLTQETQQRDAVYQQTLSAILSTSSSPAAAAQRIQNMISWEGNPDLRKRYQIMADQVRSGEIPVGG